MFRNCSRLAACIVASFALSASYGDTLSTSIGGTGTWGNPANWSPAIVPNNTPSQTFRVSIGNGVPVGLDVNALVDSLTLDSTLITDYDHSTGLYTTLTTTGNVTVNAGGQIGTDAIYSGWLDSLAVGGKLSNAGTLLLGADLSVARTVTNSGSLTLLGNPNEAFTAGAVTNTGALSLGELQNDYPSGPTSILGSLTNKGSVLITGNTTVTLTAQPNGVTDVASGTSWLIGGTFNAGSQSALARLTSVEGTLSLQNSFAIAPIGGTLTNTGTFGTGGIYGPSTITVTGKFSNSGNLVIGDQPRFQGDSTLVVQGTLINQSNGTLNLTPTGFSTSRLTAQTFVNYGAVTVDASSFVNATELDNYGTLNVAGTVQAGTFKAAGQVNVYTGNLVVGSGVASSQPSVYQQFHDGVLEVAGATINASTASLDGTLDILLGNSAKPVGTVFDILLATPFTGTFSSVQGLIFDGGRQKYILDYDTNVNIVSLTVAPNTTPEPRSSLLLILGTIILAALAARRQQSREPTLD